MSPFEPRPVELQLRAILSSLPDDTDQLRSAFQKVEDFGALLVKAQEHGVADVILAAAERVNLPLTLAVEEQAVRQKRLHAVWREVLHQALRSILRVLKSEGIRAVALKGPILGARLYGADSMRPSTDLDLLVDPAAIDAVGAALRPLGYELEGGTSGRFFRAHHHHVHALHPTFPNLELHFDAYRGFGTRLPAAPLLARSLACPLRDWSDAHVLAPEDEFLYLAVHAASHRFQSLVWLLDLKLLAHSHPDLRWDVLSSRAKEYGLSAVLTFACALLSDWLGTPRHGDAHLEPLGERRSRMARRCARPQPNHAVNAAVDFLFSALLCDDVARAAAFSGRFVRKKLIHEAPLRAKALLRS